MISVIENPGRVDSAEIVVGIPSYNEADSISIPVQEADKGVREYYPDRTSVIVNADNHSTDGTREVFLNTPTGIPKIYVSTPEEVRGKGNNMRNVFRIAADLGANAVVLLDADLTSITPRWIESFLQPLYDGYDFVVPLYSRHKYDATITNNIVYPMIRMLYGMRVRQPIAGDFGVSGKLARCFLVEKTWSPRVFQYGIDVWMTTIAICRNFNMCQTFLGSSKAHRHKDPVGLGMMFTQVVGTLFQLMSDFEYLWKNVFRSRPSVIYGFGLGQRETFNEVKVSVGRLHDAFISGYQDYSEVWRTVLGPQNWVSVNSLRQLDCERFTGHEEIWARVLIDFAVAYRRSEPEEREALLKSLIPLYHACTLSFVNKTLEMGTQETEIYLEKFCRVFEREKYYLIRNWDQSIRDSSEDRIVDLLLNNRGQGNEC